MKDKCLNSLETVNSEIRVQQSKKDTQGFWTGQYKPRKVNMDCLATADSIQTSKSQKSPSNTWMMEIFAILDDPPMSEAVKNLLVLKSRPS